jgi:4-cresol dehydrogenase (hydroxylating)
MTGISRRDVIRTGAVGAAMLGSSAFASPLDGPRQLPAHVDAGRFAAAVKELRAVVGTEWVFADPESTLPYAKSFTPDPRHEHVPSGAVAPASVEEVQAILKVANKYKLPLWTVSTGKNMGYGCATPASSGQMILDLKRMNRIIEIDAEPTRTCAITWTSTTYRSGSMCLLSARLSLLSATRWNAVWATRPMGITSSCNAVWKWC